MRNKVFRAALAVIALFSLASCASSMEAARKMPRENIRQTGVEELSKEPSIVRLPVPKEAFTIQGVKEFPKGEDVSLSFDNARLSEVLAAVSKTLKLNIVIDRSAGPADAAMPVPTPTAGPKGPGVPAQVPPPVAGPTPSSSQTAEDPYINISYHGPISGFFKALSRATGYFFVYEDGIVTVKREETFMTVIPNYADLPTEVQGNLIRLGANGIGYDNMSSTLTFRCNYNAFPRIQDYFKRIRDNAALVSLRIIVANVKLTGQENYGIDWTRVATGWGSQKQRNIGFNSETLTTTNSSLSGSSTTTTISATDALANTLTKGASAMFSNTGASMFVESARFSMSLFLSFIEQYGNFDLNQNVFLQTVSGKEGKLKVLTKTPYIENIGLGVLSAGGQATNATQGTTQSSKAESGVSMEILPQYSRINETLSIKMKVGVYGVTKFLSLPAGNLGTLELPETTEKSMETTLRMRPDQTAVIGGLIYERNTNTIKGLPGDSYLTKNQAKTSEKEELVIIVKPTITEFVVM